MAATAAEIASTIRAQILSGRLRAGDRVPSARQLTRDWGVAIATATKVLATLRVQGLVRPIVGVGTVVADSPLGTGDRDRPQGTDGYGRGSRMGPAPTGATRRGSGGSSRGAEAELTRDRIVRTAVAIADAEGLPAVTMRRLATELDVAVMSLYRHVAGKDELVQLMTEQIFSEAPLPDALPIGWRARIETLARRQWSIGKRHPWLASVMSLVRPMMIPSGMAYTDAIMRELRALGLDPQTAIHVTVALAGLLMGAGASLQLEADAQRETGLTSDEWMAQQESELDVVGLESRFPALAEISSIPGFDLHLDDVFETGLALMLDGLAQRLTPARPATTRRVARSR